MRFTFFTFLLWTCLTGGAFAEPQESAYVGQQAFEAEMKSVQESIRDLVSEQADQKRQISLHGQLAAGMQRTFEAEIQKVQESVKDFASELAVQKRQNASYEQQLAETQEKLAATESLLQKIATETNQNINEAQTRISGLGSQLGVRTFQLSLGTIFVAALGLGGLLAVFTLRKRLSESNSSLEENLQKVRESLEVESVKIDEKLVELLGNQLKLVQAHAEKPQVQPLMPNKGPKEDDHTLPLKLGEEIFRMRQRLNALPTDTKGLKPLLKSLERLEDEFKNQGYDLVEMLGAKFDDGMNVQARLIPSDELEQGARVITKVIRPQINFNGVSIQVAEIEVSTGG